VYLRFFVAFGERRDNNCTHSHKRKGATLQVSRHRSPYEQG
jgi:hypothetical protein